MRRIALHYIVLLATEASKAQNSVPVYSFDPLATAQPMPILY